MPAIDLGMAQSARQEAFGDAFLLAVAGTAGCAISARRPDDDSIDWTLSCRLSFRPKLDVQMKTWVGDDGKGPTLQYPLKVKNYNDLVLTDISVPRILVVVTMHDSIDNWLDLSNDCLSLRKCAFWVSLMGKPESSNSTTVSVSIPRHNKFDVDTLVQMMSNINEGIAL